ncbi:MAG: hypothetical protein AB7D37_15175 [Desulfovibrio sp.]
MLASLAHVSRDESRNGIEEHNAWILANAKPYTCTLEGLARESGQSLKRLKAHLQELEDKKLISVTRHFDGRITFILLPIGLDSSRPEDAQIRRKTKRLRLNRKNGAL